MLLKKERKKKYGMYMRICCQYLKHFARLQTDFARRTKFNLTESRLHVHVSHALVMAVHFQTDP